MSFRRKHYDDMEMHTIQTLGQKWASKNPQVSDYACNVFADKIAMLDIEIELLKSALESEKDLEAIEVLEVVRENLRRRGEAIYIMHSDILTNLGLKVGKTGIREISGKKKQGGDSHT